MQALSMIDTSMSIKEAVVPVKPAESKGKNFGAVIKQQHQTETIPKVQPEQQKVQKQDVSQEKTVQLEEVTQPQQQFAESTKGAPQVQGFVETEAELKTELKLELEPQQTDVQFIMTSDGEEAAISAQEFVSVEELLNQLVQQLEDADLNGEQELAGVDLAALVEQLQEVTDESGESPFAQIADKLGLELEQQQSEDQSVQADSELVGAALLNENSQVIVPQMMENLTQARQVLRQALAALETTTQTQAKAEISTGTTEAQDEGLLRNGNTAAEIDPRFAGLLKPRSEESQPQMGLRQQLQNAAGNQKAEATPANPSAFSQPLTEAVNEQPESINFTELLNHGFKGLEKLVQQVPGQVAGLTQGQNQAARIVPQAQVIQLPSGQQVAESQIFDQVVTHISGSQNGESGRMVLRLQPAELGSLKLELMVEGDRIKANLHAQTTQVQEVLERHLPQLRNALAEQGLKIDQFQVNVDQRQQGGQFEDLAQQGQNRDSSQENDWTEDLDLEEQAIPLAHLMQKGGGGINLHV